MAGPDFLGVELSGLDALEEAFEAIGVIGEKQALQAAAKKAVVPIKEEAQALAPQSGEFDGDAPLAFSIVIRTALGKSQKRKRGGRIHPVEVFVATTHPAAHLVEFGHELRKRIAKGKPGAITLRGKRATRKIGHVDAKPFMRPAFDRKHQEAARLFFKHLGTEVERVARRFARQAERGKLSRGAKRAFKVTV